MKRLKKLWIAKPLLALSLFGIAPLVGLLPGTAATPPVAIATPIT